ncbi:MAG: methyltransferase domain-containing protein [Bacteroidota bacterium]
MSNPLEQNFWAARYAAGRTGWDLGAPSPPLVAYLDGLEDKQLRILIPGAGNGYEAEYAWRRGFRNVYVLDVAAQPLASFAARLPEFPRAQLLQGDFFTHVGSYDLILEQTFFCALNPALRPDYARQMHALLKPGGKLAGLWFNRDFPAGPPFGGDRAEYLGYLTPYFDVVSFAEATDSIPPRAGSELFGVFRKPS